MQLKISAKASNSNELYSEAIVSDHHPPQETIDLNS